MPKWHYSLQGVISHSISDVDTLLSIMLTYFENLLLFVKAAKSLSSVEAHAQTSPLQAEIKDDLASADPQVYCSLRCT